MTAIIIKIQFSKLLSSVFYDGFTSGHSPMRTTGSYKASKKDHRDHGNRLRPMV